MSDYTIKRGDTLSSIAKDHGVPMGDLLMANRHIKDPNHINPGEKLHIPSGADQSSKVKSNSACQKCQWIRMRFDGRILKIISLETKKTLLTAGAVSGLPPQSPRLGELIAKGRKDLLLETDYTQPKHQNVSDAGPIPEGGYTLRLYQGMKYQKTGGPWGVGGWILQEPFLRKFTGRFGFFLHHDGGTRGTAGCIGVADGGSMNNIKRLLLDAYSNGQRDVEVEVEYAN